MVEPLLAPIGISVGICKTYEDSICLPLTPSLASCHASLTRDPQTVTRETASYDPRDPLLTTVARVVVYPYPALQ